MSQKLLLKSRTVSVSINCDPTTVYAFVSNPENLPKWATTFCRSIKQLNGEWMADTPQGSVTISLVRRNDFGILDHYVTPSAGAEVFVPMRVVPNRSGSEVFFTLFHRPEMSEEQYAQDLGLVEQDLHTLKRVMER